MSIAVAIAFAIMNVDKHTFHMDTSYYAMGQSNLVGTIYRSVLLILGSVGVFFFISIIPNKQTVISTLGMYSITVYLAHSAIIKILEKLNCIAIDNPYTFLLFAFCFTAGICFAFGNKVVAKYYQILINKVSCYLLK